MPSRTGIRADAAGTNEPAWAIRASRADCLRKVDFPATLTWSSTAASGPPPRWSTPARRMARTCFTPPPSLRPTTSSTSSRKAPGPRRWTCGRGWRSSDGRGAFQGLLADLELVDLLRRVLVALGGVVASVGHHEEIAAPLLGGRALPVDEDAIASIVGNVPLAAGGAGPGADRKSVV